MSTEARSLDEQLRLLLRSDPATMAEVLDDPWPLFARLREEAPVLPFDDMTLVSRYDDVKTVLQSPQQFSSRFQAADSRATLALRAALSDERKVMFDEVVEVQRLFLSALDGDDHQRRRDIMRRVFTPRRIALLRDSLAAYVDDLFDQLAASGDEVVEWDTIARQLPMIATCDLLDLPHSAGEDLVRWGDAILGHFFGGQTEEMLLPAHEATVAALAFVEERIELQRNAAEHSELMAALFAAEGESFDTKELTIAFLEQQVTFETTRSYLTNGLYELLRHPDAWQRLVADPSSVASAGHELLRYCSPSLWFMRITTEDVELSGVPIPAGQRVFFLMGSANHDPDHFADPDTLDFDRANARDHVAFGFGVHYCIGHALASLEAELVFGTLAERFPDVAVATDRLGDVEYVGTAQIRRVAHLPLRLGRDRGRPARSRTEVPAT